MKEIAIEGLDGSGKTTVVNNVAEQLKREGLAVQTFAPYRLANEFAGEDIYPLWKSDNGAKMVIGIMKKILRGVRTQALEEGSDVIVFDRHWMTAFTEIGSRPDLIHKWGEDLPPAAYLRVSPEIARGRSQNDIDKPWMDRFVFENYAARYDSLCRDFGQFIQGIYRNDDDVLPCSIARNIVWDFNIRR